MSAAPAQPPYTVVVGVSATSGSPHALAWAAAQARLHHGRVVAVRVLKRPPPPDGPVAGAGAHDQGGPYVDLAAAVVEALGPDHGVECRVLRGGRRRTLLAAADGADLLVLGAVRSPSSSVLASRVIASASCPVVVLPAAPTGEPRSGFSQAGRAIGQRALRAAGTSGRPGYRPPERP